MYIENVEKLTKDSVLDEELFTELFEIEENITREKKIIELQDKALELGVKTKFDNILKAKKRDLRQQTRELAKKDQMSHVTDFLDCGDNEVTLRTGAWKADHDGIRTWSERGEIVACNHPIYPARLLRNAETGKCKIELEYFTRKQWRRVIVDRKVIASANSIIQLADSGIHANSENAKYLVKYLADVEYLNEEDIKEQKSSGKLGWIDGVFLPYDNSVVFDNEDNMRSLLDSIQSCGSRKKWLDTVLDLRKMNRIEIMIYMAASLGSVLVELVGALPFVVDLWGDTGGGKTVSLMLAASIWGNPNEGGYITDAKATITAMEIRMNALNSLPMMIDDMAQIKNQDDDFSGLVYKWCAGHGKDRSNVTLGLNKQTAWQNCILTNAERSLVTETMQAGAVNRIIDVEIEGSIFGDRGNEVANVLRKNYGFIGPEWVEALQLIGEDSVRARQKHFYDKIKEATKEEPKEEKQIIPLSILLAADELSEELIFRDGARLDFDKCVGLLKGVGEVSEHKRAYNYICDEVAVNSFRFNYDPERPTQVWGERRELEDCTEILIIGTVFTKLMREGGFQDKAFLAWAKKNNLLGKTEAGRSQRMARIEGVSDSVRCVPLLIKNEEEDITEGFMRIPEDEQLQLPFE